MDPAEFQFLCDFPNSSRQINSLEELKELFDLHPATSPQDGRDGIISWFAGVSSRVNLKFFERPKLGMCLDYYVWQNHRMTDAYFSVGDREKLSPDLLMDLDEDGFALPGLFIPIEQAWLGIEDFFEDPLILSPRIDWINAKDLPPWPER